MKKLVRRRVRHRSGGVDVVADVNAVVASTSAEPGSTARSTSRSRVRVVQRPDGSEFVEESHHDEAEERPR